MKVLKFVIAAALAAAPVASYGAIIGVINGDGADTFAGGQSNSGPVDGGNSAGSGGALGGFTIKVGRLSGANDATNNANQGRAAIYVFQLPDLGLIANPFTSANLSFGLQLIDDATTAAADLYGLGRRVAPTVLASDYYFGNGEDGTDADRLQQDILTAAMNAGSENTIINTDATGDANLVTYLNAQYGAGAGVGQYVFLRLNVDGGSTAQRGYNVHTANDVDTAKRPTISFEAIPEPSTWALFALGAAAMIRRRWAC